MSGVVKAVKKVFKKAVDVHKKVFDLHKKAIDFVKDHKIAKYVVIAAAVYFTAGLAIGAFGGASTIAAAPGWGATGIFTQAATAIGAPGFGSAALFGAGATTAAAAAPAASGVAAPAAGGFTGAAVHSSFAPAVASAGAAAPAAGGGGGIIGNVAGAVGGAVQKYPVASMMLGQGIANAVEAKNAREAAEDERRYERKRSKKQGYFGMDQMGTQIDLPTGAENPQIFAPMAPAAPTQIARAAVSGQNPQTVPMTATELLKQQQQGIIQNPRRA